MRAQEAMVVGHTGRGVLAATARDAASQADQFKTVSAPLPRPVTHGTAGRGHNKEEKE